MLTSTNLDAICSIIADTASHTNKAQGPRVLSTGDFLKPVHIGPSQGGHFTLLSVREDRAELIDSLPSFRKGEAHTKALRLLQTRPEAAKSLRITTVQQRPNKCGFIVANEVARRLHVPTSTTPREHWSPILIQYRKQKLTECEQQLQEMKQRIAEIGGLTNQESDETQRETPTIPAKETATSPNPTDFNTSVPIISREAKKFSYTRYRGDSDLGMGQRTRRMARCHHKKVHNRTLDSRQLRTSFLRRMPSVEKDWRKWKFCAHTRHHLLHSPDRKHLAHLL